MHSWFMNYQKKFDIIQINFQSESFYLMTSAVNDICIYVDGFFLISSSQVEQNISAFPAIISMFLGKSINQILIPILLIVHWV